MKRRYLILLISFLAVASGGLYFRAAAGAADGALFFIESPGDVSWMDDSGIEVWDRFWIGEKDVVVVSASGDRESMLAGIGTRSGRVGPPGPLFIITDPRRIDLSLLSKHGTVIISGDHVALLAAAQASAELLAEKGMEIRRIMPPPGAGHSMAVHLPEAQTFSWDPAIQQVIDEVGSSDVWDLLGNLSGENSVTVGGSPYTIQTRNSYQTTPITNATQYCYEYFQNLGLSVAYHNYTWNGNNWRNVVGEQAGLVTPSDIYIICGHLDDMPAAAVAPGADDNASGSASVLMAAAILSQYSFEKTIRYVLFTGEEQGLIGSNYYVQDLVAAGDNILGALNFDMIAYDGDADGHVEVHCGIIAASETIGDLLIDTINEYSLTLTVEKLTTGSVGASDHARFWNAGYPAILGIEDTWAGATSDFNPNYHTVNDTRANSHLPYMTAYVKAAVGTLARLGGIISAATATPTITQTPGITPTPTITNTPLPVVPLAVLKSEGGDHNLYAYRAPIRGDWTYWDAVSRNPSPLGRDLWMVPSGNSTRSMTEVDADDDGYEELAVLKSSRGFDQNLYLYGALAAGDWTYNDARERNPSPLARDLWMIPGGNDTSLVADGGNAIASLKNQNGDYNLYLYDSPYPGDRTFWDCSARNPSALARDLWVIPRGNDAVAMCGLDTTGDGESDSLLVARNEGGDYNVYLWNLPVPGDWSFGAAMARNPSARALDGWSIPQGNSIALMSGINDGTSFDRLGVMENRSGDYCFYIWNAPRPGDATGGQAAARNPSPLARDLWVIPSGNNAVAVAAP